VFISFVGEKKGAMCEMNFLVEHTNFTSWYDGMYTLWYWV